MLDYMKSSVALHSSHAVGSVVHNSISNYHKSVNLIFPRESLAPPGLCFASLPSLFSSLFSPPVWEKGKVVVVVVVVLVVVF